MSISANYPALRPALLLDFANSQQLDPRVTFSRSTTAPYYDGKTSALAEQNLQVYSQAIGGTGWSLNQISANLNNAVAPDGTTTMSQLVENVTTANHYVNLASGISFTSGLSYTISVYMQIGVGATAPSIMQVWANNFVATAYANFNISTNAVANTNNCTAVISQVGSSTIYRCSITITATSTTSTTNLGIAFTNNNSALGFVPSYLGVATSDVKVWGFQVEQRSSVTAYNATTTTPITNYIPQLLTAPINAPRFDFNPTTGESLGLLIEQSSTNLVLWSQDFSNAAWAKANATVTTTAGIAPDGTQTAQLLVENSSYGSHGVSQAITVTSSQSYTQTIYAKAKDRTWIVMQPANNIPNCLAYFNLGTGAIGTLTNCTATITSVGNGWYKCSATFTNANSTQTQGVYLATGDGGATYTGNGYSGVYIWGMQFENLAFPTSYIPTTSAQVTRAADVANMTGTNLTSVWGSNSGTLYSSAKQYSTSVATYVQVSGSTAYTPAIGVYGSSSNSGVNGAFSISTSAYSANVINKTAFSFSFGNYLLCLNGGSVGTSASTTTLSIPTSLGIGSNGGANYLNGWLQKISLYPQVFTSTQLQALTGS